jgi:hypothetical protein
MSWQANNSSIRIPAFTIAGAVLASSIQSAELVEEGFWKDVSKPQRFKDEHFQDIVTEFTHLLLHLCDRDAFDLIPDARKKDAFLDCVFNSVVKMGADQPMTDEHPVPPFTRYSAGILVAGYGMDRLNERQAEYSQLKLFGGSGESALAGTLFWEFGNHVVSVCDHYGHNGFVQMEARILASSAYQALTPVFISQMVDCARAL